MKKFKKVLKEVQFGTPFSGNISPKKLTTEETVRAIRFSIAAEYEAIQLYTQLAESIDDVYTIKVLQDISNEEKVHVGELLKVLDKLDPTEKEHYTDGWQEAEDK